jgi:hypothetical protein
MHAEIRFKALRIPLFIIFIGLIGVGIFAKRGLRDWRMIEKKNDEIKSRILDTEAQKRELERLSYSIQHSKDEQERVVRRVLGYIRPHETIIEFD